MSEEDEGLQRLLPKPPKNETSTSERNISKSWKTDEKSLLWMIRVLIDQRFVIYGILAAVILGVQLAAVKVVTSVTSFQLLFYRSIAFLPYLLVIKFDHINSYDASDWTASVLCGALNAAGLVLAYEAVAFAHLGNVSCIITNQPIPTAILNRFFFGEPLKLVDLFLILLNFTGIFLVSKPPIIFDADEVMDYQREFIGALIATASVLCYVLSSMAIKVLTNKGKGHTGVMIFLMGVAGVTSALLQMGVTNDFHLLPRLYETPLIACVAFSSLLGAVCLVWALHKISFLLMSILFPLCAPVAYVLGCVFLNEIPDLLSISGTFLIIGSTFAFLTKSVMSPDKQELD